MSRRELSNEVWRAADIMRRDDGTNSINEYIEQISWMFFLKVFEDLEKRFEDMAYLDGKKHQRIISKKYSWSEWTKKDTKDIIQYIDNELFPFLGELSGTPEKNTIGLIFSEVRRNKMKSASNLKDVIDIINKINFNKESDSHILSIFYEDLLVKLGKESGIAGEFYTPRPMVKLMVKIINPKLNPKNKQNTRILDPFCGSCGFLIESFKQIMASGQIQTKDILILQRSVFHGYEKKSLPYLVGLMNCILHELITPNIFRRNSLTDNIMKFGPDDKFDYVLTNPPFGGTENKQIQQNFPVKVQTTELLALQQIMRRLKQNGKCAMVVPDGILFRGDSFKKVKKELLENYNLHTIISIPSGGFANVTSTGQGPKTSLIFFDKTSETKQIWYYELVPPGGKKYTKNNPIKDEELEDCYKKWKNNSISKNSWIVDMEEIMKRDYDLSARNPNIKKYTKFDDPIKQIDEILKITDDVNSELNDLKKMIQTI
jgi:type I restriction enzyme M protein